MLIENLWLKNPLVSFFTWTVKILDIFLSGWSNECVIQLLKCVISYAQACFSDLQPDWPKQTCQPMMYFYVCLCISIHFYIVAWDCWIYPEIHQFSDPTAAFFLAAVEFLGHELVPRASKAAGSSLGYWGANAMNTDKCIVDFLGHACATCQVRFKNPKYQSLQTHLIWYSTAWIVICHV